MSDESKLLRFLIEKASQKKYKFPIEDVISESSMTRTEVINGINIANENMRKAHFDLFTVLPDTEGKFIEITINPKRLKELMSSFFVSEL